MLSVIAIVKEMPEKALIGQSFVMFAESESISVPVHARLEKYIDLAA